MSFNQFDKGWRLGTIVKLVKRFPKEVDYNNIFDLIIKNLSPKTLGWIEREISTVIPKTSYAKPEIFKKLKTAAWMGLSINRNFDIFKNVAYDKINPRQAFVNEMSDKLKTFIRFIYKDIFMPLEKPEFSDFEYFLEWVEIDADMRETAETEQYFSKMVKNFTWNNLGRYWPRMRLFRTYPNVFKSIAEQYSDDYYRATDIASIVRDAGYPVDMFDFGPNYKANLQKQQEKENTKKAEEELNKLLS